MNITSLKEDIVKELDNLPSEGIKEVADFINFLKFKTTESSQAYFWTSSWQEREKEVDKALNEGRYRDFDDVNSAIEWLNR